MSHLCKILSQQQVSVITPDTHPELPEGEILLSVQSKKSCRNSSPQHQFSCDIKPHSTTPTYTIKTQIPHTCLMFCLCRRLPAVEILNSFPTYTAVIPSHFLQFRKLLNRKATEQPLKMMTMKHILWQTLSLQQGASFYFKVEQLLKSTLAGTPTVSRLNPS